MKENKNRTSHRTSGALVVMAVLGVASVAHWLVTATIGTGALRSVYHMIAGVQGFITGLLAILCCCWLPEVAGSRRPSRTTVNIVVIASVATVVTAWLRFAVPPPEIMLAVAEITWAVVLVTMLKVIVPRFSATPGADRPAAIWLITAVILGVAGACLVSTYSTMIVVRQMEIRWLVFLGRGYLLQSFPIALVLAAGAPLAAGLRGQTISRSSAAAVIGSVTLMISVPVEFWLSHHLGLGLRAGLILCALWPLIGAQLPKPIGRAALYLPLGYGLAALAPNLRQAGLHVVFMGGLTLGLMAAITRWLGGNDSVPKIARKIFAPAMEAAMVVRVLGEFLPAHELTSWALSTLLFMVSLTAWALVVSRRAKKDKPISKR